MMRALAAAVVALALAAPAGAASTPARYIVVEMDADGNLTPVWETRVRLDLPAGAPVLAAAATAERNGEPTVEAALLDPAGGVRYREVVRPMAWLRGEFAATGGTVSPIAGHLLPRGTVRFVVRVPAIAGARLLLRSGGPAVEVPAVLPGTAAAALDAVAGAPVVTAIQSSGSPANRLDVLVVGEGYTASGQAKFLADVDALLTAFFAASPYAEYRELMNISALYLPSREEGADHPAYRADCPAGDPTCCADTDALGDPLAGRFVDTAFDARFCTFGIQRLLTVDDGKVLAAAAAAPDWDIVLVLVDDATYGGSGGQLAVVSTHATAAQIAQHELGHSFAWLADEYDSPYPGYPGCSDVVGQATCEANVTDQLDRALVKWAPWILPGTPVPTLAGDPAFATAIGEFEGARYTAAGMYRPRRQCLMRQLGRPFCEVCRQEFVLRLLGGGWGVPATGIDPIDPGSEIPPPGPVGVAAGGTLSFSVRLLRPAATPSLSVSWLVDGERLPGAEWEELAWTPPGPGTHRVELAVADATGFVHPQFAPPPSRRVWDVTIWSARHPRRRALSVGSGP
jgi:hypothetical protein